MSLTACNPAYVLTESSADSYVSLFELPSDLVAPLCYYATHLLAQFTQQGAWFILPHSSLSPYSPRDLPSSRLQVKPSKSKGKRGRRTDAERARISEANWSNLSTWVEAMPALDGASHPPAPKPNEYQYLKTQVKGQVTPERLRAAEEETLKALRQLDRSGLSDTHGLDRAERAFQDPLGLFGLVEGSGKDDEEDS